ncbi:DNA ligase 1-like protein [Hyaloraphidium curvatum]|nr:DNA ligase 1-like protein [Hyaloraphidium curvatum]
MRCCFGSPSKHGVVPATESGGSRALTSRNYAKKASPLPQAGTTVTRKPALTMSGKKQATLAAFFGGGAAKAKEPPTPAKAPSDGGKSSSEDDDDVVAKPKSRRLKRPKAVASSDSEPEPKPAPSEGTTPEKENGQDNGRKKRKKRDDGEGDGGERRQSAAEMDLDDALDRIGTPGSVASRGKVAAMRPKSAPPSAGPQEDEEGKEADAAPAHEASPAKRARSLSRSRTPEPAAQAEDAEPEAKAPSRAPSPKKEVKKAPAKNALESMMAASAKKGKGKEAPAASSSKKADKDADEDGHEAADDMDAEAAAQQALKSLGSQTAEWKQGEKVPYAALCRMFEKNEATTKRLEKIDITRSFFQSVFQLSPENLLETVYLCLNKIAPDYEGHELGVGVTILMKAIAGATGRSVPAIKSSMEEVGDLGEVAETSRNNQRTMFKPKPLTVPQVFKTLKEIASFSGQKSQEKKVEKIQSMIAACNGSEAKFLIRSLEGKLRIGLAEKTVLVALGHAAVLARPENKKLSADKLVAKLAAAGETISAVFTEMPSYDRIVPVLLDKGIDALADECHLTPGIPLKPMLAHPTKAITDVLNRFEGIKFTCEWKYDGERAQVHRLEDGSTFIYSRNSENLTPKYPEVLERIGNAAKEGVKSFVLDCECVAWDREKKQIRPFQALSTRKRKDVNIADIEIQVVLFAFDILYLDGDILIRKPLEERRRILHENFREVEGEFAFAQYDDGHTVEEIQRILDESIAGGCEGLMVKTLDKEASYEPSKRSRNWLKVKKDYLADNKGGIGDSLDLVVIGGYHGRGKRTGGYGGFLLACYDSDNEQYQTICKIGTGFSDEDLSKHTNFFKEHVIDIPRPYYIYSDDPRVVPDVWFEPVQVWEVKCADLSISPVHKAGIGEVHGGKGISLRFPRFIRIRDDKGPEDATTADQVAEMYRSQAVVSNGKGGINDVDY